MSKTTIDEAIDALPEFDGKEAFLIDFYDKFARSREYVSDGRFKIRKNKIKALYKIYKKQKLSKKTIYSQIAKEVSYILPTNWAVVREIINAK